MTPERWQRVCGIFAAALRCSPAERGALLAAACADDPQLRAEVERLLADDDIASRDGSRDLPTVADIPFRPIAEGPGARIGPYKLLQAIGEGGMGVVYLAEQDQPVRRRVALKIIKPGMDTAQVIARFAAERQALALMDHPHGGIGVGGIGVRGHRGQTDLEFWGASGSDRLGGIGVRPILGGIGVRPI